MNYREFREKIGKFHVPDEEQKKVLVRGKDSMHFVIHIGSITGNDYKIDATESNMDLFASALDILESRKAVRGIDYIVTGSKEPTELLLQIHTTHEFLSDEDFPSEIKRLYAQ